MKRNYYTPEIEEFHIGFEYEIYENFDKDEDKSWHPMVYGDTGTGCEDMAYPLPPRKGRIRVKFLDNYDIESLGWCSESNNIYSMGEVRLEMINMADLIWLDISIEASSLFIGCIKNKCELKRLMKQLGI